MLRQSGAARFPLCFKNDTHLKDGFVQVKFKPVSGSEDEAGGVVWRCLDANNYYVARANALENNVIIYHVIRGRRASFSHAEVKVSRGVWHALRVDFKGSRFIVTFDGKQVIDASDDSLTRPGKLGVWTKSDSVTLFDDFSFGPN